jgi:ribosomal protein L7Ae-like RNA K-turn-binding protein
MNDLDFQKIHQLLNKPSKLVGLRATLKGVKHNLVECVILADNADQPIKEQIANVCEQSKVEIIYFPSKQELGSLCNIKVSCACVGILK